jgi:hypothetical protein
MLCICAGYDWKKLQMEEWPLTLRLARYFSKSIIALFIDRY